MSTDPKSSQDIKSDDVELQAEAQSLMNLNKELENIIGSTEKSQDDFQDQTIGQEVKARNFITSRGYEVFNYEEIRQKYDQGIPIIRDFQLPLAKPLIKQHLKFWSFFTPVCGTFIHLMLHLKKQNTSKDWFNKNIIKAWAGVYALGFSSSCMYTYFVSPYW